MMEWRLGAKRLNAHAKANRYKITTNYGPHSLAAIAAAQQFTVRATY